MTWRKREIMEMAHEVKMPYDFVTGEPINLEKLETFAALVREEQQTEVQRLIALVRAQQITIDKLEAALAQPAPVQELVAHDYRTKYDRGCYKCLSQFCPGNCIDTTPPAAQPEQEPIGYLCENATGHRYFRWKKPPSVYNPIALYAKP
jgi:hypothetical protein